MFSEEIIKVLKEAYAEDDKNLFQVIVCTLDTFSIHFQSLAQLSSRLYATVILSIYANYVASHLRCLKERERERQ